ncbi:hypothetical protein KUCAC02_002247 [Chaenocephalus aceratus]|uniref:Uncharacterized protein n=1 Tax=Chaenocephalus aceratus TaxID=36190 RepID=A0ACB9XUG5_CHAAC|nr:hypothetical protein KUCAC02_002247 [Chaenocephalus aceratus]
MYGARECVGFTPDRACPPPLLPMIPARLSGRALDWLIATLGTTSAFQPGRGHLGSSAPMFFCPPNEGFSSTTSPLLPGHFGKLCSTSYLQRQRGVRRG